MRFPVLSGAIACIAAAILCVGTAAADPVANPHATVVTLACPAPYGTLTIVTTTNAAAGQVLGTTQNAIAYYVALDGQVFLDRATNASALQGKLVTCYGTVFSPNDLVVKLMITP